jgi:hypothetical protein
VPLEDEEFSMLEKSKDGRDSDVRSAWLKFILPTFLPARALGSMMNVVACALSASNRRVCKVRSLSRAEEKTERIDVFKDQDCAASQ